VKDGICPKCSSTEIMANLTILDRGYFNTKAPVRVLVEEPRPAKTDPFWMSDGASGQLQVYVCSQCGYTEFYTDNFENMYKKYKRFGLDK
jgi:predicted nucleic-acid-binding Zn-ribbon protein